MNISNLDVLYIEDEPADIVFLEKTLQKDQVASYSVDSVNSLASAETALRNKAYHVLLLDLSLPDSSGLESIEFLNRIQHDAAIVVLTGLSSTDIALGAIKEGAQDYLVKGSFTSELLGRTLRHALERKQSQLSLQVMARSDVLTGVSNRVHFNNQIEILLERAKRLQNSVSMFFIDFDQFKIINDTMGHLIGDVFLREVAKRLVDCLRPADFVARVGGDEFVVVVEHETISSTDDIYIAEKLLSTLSVPVCLESGQKIASSCSIGIAEYNPISDELDPKSFYIKADTAMYRAKKRGGRCYQFYDEETESLMKARVELIRGLKTAMEDKQFEIFYQPIICTSKYKVIAWEALLRWEKEPGHYVSPAEFIPLLEETHRIVEVGVWVLEQACLDFKRLKAMEISDESCVISVNVSPMQFEFSDFVATINRTLQQTNMSANDLQLEITETLPMNQPGIIDTLTVLKDQGIKLAIDDFGTGFSSMKYLKDMPFDTLKIDLSFIQSYMQDEKDRVITHAMINLGKSLGKHIVAEGVEDEHLVRTMIEIGCDSLQGYYFSRPQPVDKIPQEIPRL